MEVGDAGDHAIDRVSYNDGVSDGDPNKKLKEGQGKVVCHFVKFNDSLRSSIIGQ